MNRDSMRFDRWVELPGAGGAKGWPGTAGERQWLVEAAQEEEPGAAQEEGPGVVQEDEHLEL